MEEEWWNSEESENTPPDGPKTVVISNSEKVTNTLSGEVNLSSVDQHTVWGNSENEKKFVFPSWAWFLVGLIVVPVLLSFVSALLNDFNTNQDYWADSYSSDNDDVTINEDLFDVYRFDMRSGFGDAYLSYGNWEISVEFNNNDPNSYAYWYCDIDGNYQEINVDQVDDSDGNGWMECELNNWNGDNRDDKVYLRIKGNNIYVATQSDNFPAAVNYWHEYNENSGAAGAACMIWPVVIIGGSIFGFVTQRRALAYGLMTFVGLIFVGFLLFFFLLLSFGF